MLIEGGPLTLVFLSHRHTYSEPWQIPSYNVDLSFSIPVPLFVLLPLLRDSISRVSAQLNSFHSLNPQLDVTSFLRISPILQRRDTSDEERVPSHSLCLSVGSKHHLVYVSVNSELLEDMAPFHSFLYSGI